MVNLSKPLGAAIKQGRRIEHVAHAGAAGLKGSRQVGGSALQMSNKVNKAGLKARGTASSAATHVSQHKGIYASGALGGAVGGVVGNKTIKKRNGQA